MKRTQAIVVLWCCVVLIGLAAVALKVRYYYDVQKHYLQVSDVASNTCPEEAHQAALHVLFPLLGVGPSTEYPVEDDIKVTQKKIDCLRPWATSLKDPCQRHEVVYWLDLYSQQFVEAWTNMKTRKPQIEAAAANERYKEESRRLKTYMDSHPYPKLPQCEDK